MIKPVGNRILVLPTAPDETSKGGLLLKKLENDKQNSGKIVSVGDGYDVEMFNPGEFVIFFKYGPQEVLIDGVAHLSVHFDEILAFEPMEEA